MNKVLLIGRLTRDPEMRTVANGRAVTTTAIVTEAEEVGGNDGAVHEYHTIVGWDSTAEAMARALNVGDLVHVEGTMRTRTWEDERKIRHYKPECIVKRILVIKEVIS